MAKSIKYRKDIDGLRGIAVLAVVFFHMGYMSHGYLGVDVFFVISGFLITTIIYNESLENRFSIIEFYLRRIRRIIPLILFVSIVSLIIGIIVMLPDDLENLAQSIIATNFFANNILLLITTGNYWDVVNDFKPLMHTWSLGVEEQFYVIFPLLFIFLSGKRIKWLMPVLIFLTLVSIILYIISANEANKFYLLQFRFYELAIGGIGAILFNKKLILSKYRFLIILGILFLLLCDIGLPHPLLLILTVLLSGFLLVSKNAPDSLLTPLIENKIIVSVGVISYSLYMWHQLVLAFTRYAVTDSIGYVENFVIFIVIILLSIGSYYFVEKTFRDKAWIKTKKLLITLSVVFLIIISSSFFVYKKAGVLKDFPEMDIYQNQSQIIKHSEYNDRIYTFDKDFKSKSKIKVLLIGDSFARDWGNILLESKYSKDIELSYIYDRYRSPNIIKRCAQADIIYFSTLERNEFDSLKIMYKIDENKVSNIGTKNFGTNNGIFYNRRAIADYCLQRANIDSTYLTINNRLKNDWGEKYIDILGFVMDSNGTVPVFTKDCKFISQDSRHLTKNGAKYFAEIWNNKTALSSNLNNKMEIQ